MAEVPRSQPLHRWVDRIEWLEEWEYLTAGLSFLVIGMVAFAHAWVTFFAAVQLGVISAVLVMTNGLLCALILLELLRTVINFLKSHGITLEPSCLSESLRGPGGF